MEAKTMTLDGLGRVIIPRELREQQGWNEHDVIEFYCKNDTIVMQKVEADSI